MKNHELCYLIDVNMSLSTARDKTLEVLKTVKEREKKKNFISVWVDDQTLKFIDIEKINRLKLQIIRVRLPSGRIVWIEKNNAIKKGFIKEE